MGKTTAQLSVAQYQALITGIPQYASNATFKVASQTFTAKQAVTFLQTLHDSSAATAAAKASWKQSLANDEVAEAQNGTVARQIRDTIALMFSNAPATLQAFGLEPHKKPTPLSAEARVAANEKAKATRAARGTKGSVQKAAITGNVTGVTITPVTIPTAGATSAPAPAAAVVTTPAPSVSPAPATSPAPVAPAPVVTPSPAPAAPPAPAPVATSGSNGSVPASSTAPHS